MCGILNNLEIGHSILLHAQFYRNILVGTEMRSKGSRKVLRKINSQISLPNKPLSLMSDTQTDPTLMFLFSISSSVVTKFPQNELKSYRRERFILKGRKWKEQTELHRV